MKRLATVTALAIAVSAAAAGGQEFTRAIIDSFPLPTSKPYGVEWVEELEVMFIMDEQSSLVYSVTPEGVVTTLIDLVAVMGIEPGVEACNGVCYLPGSGDRDGTLFIADYGGSTGFPHHDKVYEFALDGTWLNTWNVNTPCGSGGVSGIAYDGVYWWLHCGYYIVKCDSDFNAIDSFEHPNPGGTTQGGLDYDPSFDVLYIADYYGGDVYVVDPSDYSTLDVFGPWFDALAGVSVGRTTRYRARTLWVTCRDTHRLYEIDDEYDTPVSNPSWGTIKAIYR